MFEAIWKPKGSKKTTILGIFGTYPVGVRFIHEISGEPIPQEEIVVAPFDPFKREWLARARILDLVQMDRENAEAEGRDPNAGLILALSHILDRPPIGQALDLERSISDTWCERIRLQDGASMNQDPVEYSEDELLGGKTRSGA